jgi:hypothetical protein
MLLFSGCSNQDALPVPEKIIAKRLTKLISGDDAIKVIDKLHGLDVTPENNVIAEYGEDPKDLLYISKYSTEIQAKKSFESMLSKMIEAESGPFTHIMALPDYDEKVYICLGMGAIHYIFHSTNYVIWLQSFQDIGRELPDNLIKLYPII